MYLQGILAVSDKFNRIRLLFDNESSLIFLSNLLINIKNVPYIKHVNITDNIYGECIFTIQKKYTKYWLDKAKEWRGKKVSIEFKQRNWSMGNKKGISFDIININLL